MNAVRCVFIFTSYSSLKGSFVVCCLIDFNENHSIVAKVDFRKLFLLVWVEGEGGRGLMRTAGLWGGFGNLDVHDAWESTTPQSPAKIHA